MTLSTCALKSWAWEEKPSRDCSHLMYHDAFSNARAIDLHDVFLNETRDVVNASRIKNSSGWGYRKNCKELILKAFPSNLECIYLETRLRDCRLRNARSTQVVSVLWMRFQQWKHYPSLLSSTKAVGLKEGILLVYFYCFILFYFNWK